MYFDKETEFTELLKHRPDLYKKTVELATRYDAERCILMSGGKNINIEDVELLKHAGIDLEEVNKGFYVRNYNEALKGITQAELFMYAFYLGMTFATYKTDQQPVAQLPASTTKKKSKAEPLKDLFVFEHD